MTVFNHRQAFVTSDGKMFTDAHAADIHEMNILEPRIALIRERNATNLMGLEDDTIKNYILMSAGSDSRPLTIIRGYLKDALAHAARNSEFFRNKAVIGKIYPTPIERLV